MQSRSERIYYWIRKSFVYDIIGTPTTPDSVKERKRKKSVKNK
jgi:hypothetical protein